MLSALAVHARSGARCASHWRSKSGGVPMGIQSAASTQRLFWGFSKKDDDPAAPAGASEEAKELERREGETERPSKGIVSPHGDFSPSISPLLILPTAKKPIFPGYLSAITLKDEATIEALVEGKTGNNYVGVFLRKDEPKQGANTNNDHSGDVITNASEIYHVGTFAQVQNVIRSEFGTQVVLMGNRRISLEKFTSLGPPSVAEVTHWKKPRIAPHSDIIKAQTNEVLTLARELIKLSPLLQEQLQVHNWVAKVDLHDPSKFADFATALTTADGADLQRVLEAEDIEERLSIVLELLAKEKELAKLQKEISRQVEEKVSKQQREYFLREQLKSIKKELGMEKDDKEDLLNKYREQLHAIESRPAVKEDTLKLIRDEVHKLESLEKNSPEFNVTRSYLDWLVAVPWGHLSQDLLQLQKARAVLDEDHYGLEDVKTRILEFIAVGKLRGTVSGKILCLIGPPGVGKTSIATSIARALDKKFFRFSVGGLTDTAEIKGHRRTYVGAMPGKPVQSLKATKCLNPLILIDEIDKLGRSYNGDPASALLELLDPNQNSSFVDHYMDTPIDFSNVLFVCTANDESTIPGPLRDRMEIIRLSGYDVQEKVAIASKYLVPKALHDAGLIADRHAPQDEFVIPNETLEVLIKNYCRESGVRSLEKKIDRIARKIAFNRVGAEESDSSAAERRERIVIQPADVEKFAGKPIFAEEAIYESKEDAPLPPGIVMGLAWNPLGGSPIFIETVSTPTAYSERDSGIHMVTGQLGSVMKESASIAYTFAKKFVAEKNAENKFFHSHQLHLHVPEGAISKDGPSAGVAMATSFISIALNQPLNPKLAMTGELSLTGKVLPVGGIKEKSLAAKRAGARTIILPAANKRDFDELADYIKHDVTVHFVKEYSEVYEVAFSNKS